MAVDGNWTAAMLFALPVAVMLVNVRLGAVLLALGLLPWVLYSGTSHVVLVFMVAIAVALFPAHRQRRLLYRTQLTALWFWAGMSKLLSEAWMSGAAVEQLAEARPLGVLPITLVVWATIIGEIGAAMLLWVDDRAALAAGFALHLGIIAAMFTGEFGRTVALLIFNGLPLAMLTTAVLPKQRRLRLGR